MSRDRKMGLRTVPLALASLMLLILVVPSVYARPDTDVLRLVVIQAPAAKLVAMQIEAAYVWPSSSNAMDLPSVPEFQTDSLMGESDVDTLDANGFLILEDPAFHTGFIGFNIRDTATIQSYYRPGITYWPLADAEFRHALIHSYDQSRILQTLYGYTVMHARSLVPPIQRKYFNPNVSEHLYNPGNPFTSVEGDGTSCGILKGAGYTFVDAGPVGPPVDSFDYWNMSDGNPLPGLTLWTPLIVDAPASFQHGAEFVADLAAIGLAATAQNGNSGFTNVGMALGAYLGNVYGTPGVLGGFFDAFMGFTSFGRLPDQLYTSYYSGQDTRLNWFGGNAVGMNDVTIDSLVETVEYSLDTDEIGVAAKQVQEKIYDPTLPNADNFALAYMYLYNKIHFSAYNPDLEGIVRSPGYGTDSKWTYLNINWKPGLERRDPDGSTVITQILDDAPNSLNPLSATTNNEWEILEQVYDGLTNINPYNHYDIPWIATDWSIVETPGGMNIYYTIRNDVMWQDGIPLTVDDINFSLEFMRDRNVQRYNRALQTLEDVVITSPTTFYIECNRTSISLFYDFNGLATLLPPQIWDQPWPNDLAVQLYDPTVNYQVAPGYMPGPTPPPTNLFGTGPWIFQFYDVVNAYSDLWANVFYFMSQAARQTLMTQMFWEVGDQDQNGVINVVDLNNVGSAYGSVVGDPYYNPTCDFNSDGIVDMRDLVTLSRRFTWQREYAG